MDTEFVTHTVVSLDDEDRVTYQLKNEELTLEGREKALVLLFLGQSGVGKSFLIDLMCNHLKGRAWNASERYKITDDSLGDEVTAYSMKKTSLGRPVMVIDTPGLGDVVEYQRNQEVISKIGVFLLGLKLEINSVCYVRTEKPSPLHKFHQE